MQYSRYNEQKPDTCIRYLTLMTVLYNTCFLTVLRILARCRGENLYNDDVVMKRKVFRNAVHSSDHIMLS